MLPVIIRKARDGGFYVLDERPIKSKHRVLFASASIDGALDYVRLLANAPSEGAA